MAGSGVSYCMAADADFSDAKVFFLGFVLLSWVAIALVLLTISCYLGVTPIFIILLVFPLRRDIDGVTAPLPMLICRLEDDPIALVLGD